MNDIRKQVTKKQIQRLHVLYHKRGFDDEAKKAMIHELTNGRTTTTKELTFNEAVYLSGYLNGGIAESPLTSGEKELKKCRSDVLKRIQKLGIDTTDWNIINGFCMNKRITGKLFYDLSVPELKKLIPKLEAILSRKL